jgi:hypothetical protein
MITGIGARIARSILCTSTLSGLKGQSQAFVLNAWLKKTTKTVQHRTNLLSGGGNYEDASDRV